MEINTNNLTRTGYASVVMLCGVLTVGCAGNSAKPKALQAPVQPVAQHDKNNPADTMLAQEQETVKTEQESTMSMTKPADEAAKFPGVDISENILPKQMSFFFQFDKAALDIADVAVVKQHAKFMLDNPGLILKISGHTDQYGPRAYNEYLSKKRADKVAEILIAEGVSESQLVISALASDEPLQAETDKRKNRRVELEYNEINLVSNR